MANLDFNGQRVRLTRVFRGLTQSEVAAEVAASPALISQLESGGRDPSTELLEALSHVLGVEPAFFAERTEDEFKEDECNFRRRRTTPERLQKRLLAHGTLLGLVIRHLEKKLELPRYAGPESRAETTEEIERAAETCRETWSLGLDSPVSGLGRLLERSGVVLSRLKLESEDIDPFSRFGMVSVVEVDTVKGGSQAIFDMAHELGHGVMHRGIRTGNPQTEEQADRFATAFLLPRTAFRREFWAGGRLDWTYLLELKRRWGASVATIVRRAYELDVVDAATYRRARKHMYAQGWAHGEPDEPEVEKPALLEAALSALHQKTGAGVREIAAALNWKPTTFESVTGVDAEVLASVKPEVFSLGAYRERRHGTGG
ncbi:MAG: ImmA/IrrE family metallo-endopeptidase [Gemmatimonadetes bacterium]|nr:ImmA/IrrE family metallo-endopeptidase [Gemmatimonadota bacterium]